MTTTTQTVGQTIHVTPSTHATQATPAPYAALPRRERRAVSYCNIWDLVAPGDPCPACEDTFEDRLARARSGNV